MTLDLIPDFSRYPFLTSNMTPVRGALRQKNADFQVDEVPLGPLEGDGEFLHVRVEKEGWTTRSVILAVRHGLGLGEEDVAWAGLKDRHALTRQWISIPRAAEPALDALELPDGVKLLERGYHSTKLHVGHLTGNNFRILLRDPVGGGQPEVEAILARLASQGVPNYFGPQRFGYDGKNAERGMALIRKGRGRSKRWLDKLNVNALQSLVFNDWLALRLTRDMFDTVIEGDIAHKLATGGKFLVGDAEVESPRARAFEITTSGPLLGRKYHEAKGPARAIEDEVLAARGLTRENFNGCPGNRRAARWPLTDARVETAPEGLWLSFFLPAGGYATAVLREVMQDEARDDEDAVE